MGEVKKKQVTLFSLDENARPSGKQLKRPDHPIWTEQKAALIQRYMKLFVMITRHGTYLDGFAGPQYPDKPDMWAARLVLETRPKWLRHFYLFETDKKKFPILEKLVHDHERPADRTIEIFREDSNVGIARILASGVIPQKEATFCLLDQHTFECEWATLERIAGYKQAPHNKIEIFYFLAQSWLQRAIHATEDHARLERWWGRADWTKVVDLSADDRALLLASRFKKELGYTYAVPYPIYGNEDGTRVMYTMIHATDHDEAPELMNRAYRTIHKQPRDFVAALQAPLLGDTWMLATEKDGSHLVTCAKCIDATVKVEKDASAAVAELRGKGWTSDAHNRWVCVDCAATPKKRRPSRAK